MVKQHSTNSDGIVGKICNGFKCEPHWCPLDKFGKDKNKPDGLNYWCKDCKYNCSQSPEGIITQVKASKKYRASDYGKLVNAITHAKHRNLGFNRPYGDNVISELYTWHHINHNDMVTVPRDLHQIYTGSGFSLIQHRFMVNQIVKQLYMGMC